jgi:hypothetical protein
MCCNGTPYLIREGRCPLHSNDRDTVSSTRWGAIPFLINRVLYFLFLEHEQVHFSSCYTLFDGNYAGSDISHLTLQYLAAAAYNDSNMISVTASL